MDKKKFEFSKVIIVSMFLVLVGIIVSIFMMDLTAISDVAVFCTMLTVVGGILGTALGFYYKKAQSENLMYINTKQYKEMMSIQVEFIKSVADIKQRYELTDDDIEEIKNKGTIDDVCDSFVSTMTNEADLRTADAHSEVE